MKVLCILLMSVFALHADDTNVLSTFRVGAAIYRNVTISQVTDSDAIIRFDGGGARVALSNCPAWFQEKYGYDPKLEAKAVQIKTAAEKTNREQQQKSATQNVQLVTILNVTGYSPYLRCYATGVGEMFVSGLPADATKYLKSIDDLESAIGIKYTQIELDESDTYETAFNIPTPGERTPRMVLEKRNNVTPADIEREKKELEKLKAKFELLESKRSSYASVYVQKTGQFHKKIPIYKCVGKPAAGTLNSTPKRSDPRHDLSERDKKPAR